MGYNWRKYGQSWVDWAGDYAPALKQIGWAGYHGSRFVKGVKDKDYYAIMRGATGLLGTLPER